MYTVAWALTVRFDTAGKELNVVTAETLCVAIGKISLLAFFVIAVAATIVGHRRSIRADRAEHLRAGRAGRTPPTLDTR